MNRTDRPARPATSGPDPVLWLMIAACAVLATVGLLMAYRVIHDARAQAALHCPAPDHPVWAAAIHQWICGEPATFGVKSR